MSTEDSRKQFDLWYLQDILNRYRHVLTLAAQTQQQQEQPHTTSLSSRTSSAAMSRDQQQPQSLSIDVVESLAKAAAAAAQLTGSTAAANAAAQNRSPDPQHRADHLLSDSQSAPTQSQGIKSQQQQQSSNATGFVRTRIRTSFDPELELPKLHKWFSENQHPSRTQVHQYVEELNALESRRGRKPLDSNNVVYWFKNARAAHKRQELKGVNGWTENSSNSSNTPPNKSASLSLCLQDLDPHMHQHHVSSDQTSGMATGNRGDEDGGDEQDSMHDQSDRHVGSENDDDESNSSSTFPRTLDLSMRPVAKRRRITRSPERITGDQHSETRIKDEVCSDPDDDDDDADEEEEEDYYYASPTHQTSGQAFCDGNGSDSAVQHQQHNGHTHPFKSSHTSPSNNSLFISNNPDSPDNGSEGSVRVRRSRTFIDPMSEVPRLEQWFGVNTHPTHSQIVRYTEELNRLQYRQKFPRLEPKNIQFWFKNRRAKYKRLSLSPNSALTQPAVSGNNEICQVNDSHNGPTSISSSSTLSPNSSAGQLLQPLSASSLITSSPSNAPSSAVVTTTTSSSSPPLLPLLQPSKSRSNNRSKSSNKSTTLSAGGPQPLAPSPACITSSPSHASGSLVTTTTMTTSSPPLAGPQTGIEKKDSGSSSMPPMLTTALDIERIFLEVCSLFFLLFPFFSSLPSFIPSF